MLLVLLVYVLFVNGAVPGLLSPTTGQAVWIAGFAKSLVQAPTFSVFAHDIGLPHPAAISFGLPGVLVTAFGLKLGLPAPDAYSLACAAWLAVAFWGAFSVCRSIGGSVGLSAFAAATWLTFPVVWRHGSYSMLAVGIALIPAYYYTASRVLSGPHPFRWYPVFLAMCVVSSFMDGYSFVMFASITLAAVGFDVLGKWREPRPYFAALALLLGFVVSYFLYNSYSNSIEFRDNVDFFRGWGADISFLMTPTRGELWLPDLLGQSVARTEAAFFGDASVYLTSFSLIAFVLAVGLLVSPFGNRKVKLLFFVVGVISLYLSLGPSFKFNSMRPPGMGQLMPAEYALGPTGTAFLWEKVPGLYNMRAVYRWVALAIVGFWGVIIAALVDKRLPRPVAYGTLVLLLLFNLPQPVRFLNSYANARTAFLALDADLAPLRSQFREGEVVAFLPAGNDFLINYLAPHLNIRTYNIGGDKNAVSARRYWPAEVQEAARFTEPSEVTRKLLRVLEGSTDAVAIPYVSLLFAAHRWPYPHAEFEEMQPFVSDLRSTGLFDVVDTDHFAIVRLKPEVAAHEPKERERILVGSQCRDPDGGYRVLLISRAPMSFSQVSSLCGGGWSKAEGWGRWSVGNEATLYYEVPGSTGNVLEFDAVSYVAGQPASQRVFVNINGEPATQWVFTSGSKRQVNRVPIPEGVTSIKVEFLLPDARSPQQAGESGDARVLGLGLVRVCLTPSDTECLL